MRKHAWEIKVGVGLVALSAALYMAHYLMFGDAHHILIYLVGDIAFVPIEVLIVTLILHRLLSIHEKQSMLSKMNMVIGAFFSEVGTDLLERLAAFDPSSEAIRESLVPGQDWTPGRFVTVSAALRKREHAIDPTAADLVALRDFLCSHREFMLRLLENPNLLEHDSFTDLLWAAFHLTEELAHRADLSGLPESDLDHLAGDVKRAYGMLTGEWIDYMQHLKGSYPYLFSLAVRTNPFDPDAKPEVA